MNQNYSDIPEELRKQYEAEPIPGLVPLSDIVESQPQWLFTNRIPKGEITIFAGDGGSGKTALICQIVAAISKGSECILDTASDIPVNFSDRKPSKVLFFSSEDDFSKVLKHRLTVYDGRMENIKTIEVTHEAFHELKFNSELLEQILRQETPTLCVFDPLQSFIPESVNMGARNEMRNCINPLIGLARKYNTTFIIVCHTNKRTSAFGRNRVADSSDVWDLCRSLFVFGVADNDSKVRYFSQEKSNYGVLSPTILFNIDQDGRVVYSGITDKHDRDFVTASDNSKTALGDVEGLITSRLSEAEGKYLKTSDLDEYMLCACGASKATISRAKTALKSKGIISYYSQGYGDKKTWFTRLKD